MLHIYKKSVKMREKRVCGGGEKIINTTNEYPWINKRYINLKQLTIFGL